MIPTSLVTPSADGPETGAGNDVDATGSIVVQKARTGDPDIDRVTEILESKKLRRQCTRSVEVSARSMVCKCTLLSLGLFARLTYPASVSKDLD